MCTRSTPFGLFAGITLGNIADKTSIILDEKITRKTRLDMYLLSRLHESLLKDDKIKQKIKYKLNSSIHVYKNKFRYIEADDSIKHKHIISEVYIDKYIKAILKGGDKYHSFKYFVDIIKKFGFEEGAANDFIYQLINAQILIDEFSLHTTGEDYFKYLINKLEKIDSNSNILRYLKKIQDLLDELDEDVNSSFLKQKYDEIISILNLIKVDYNKECIFQVDYLKNSIKANIDLNIANQIQRIIPLLNYVSGNSENERLKLFKEKFASRYNTRKMPINEVLDSEYGVGYGSVEDNLNMLNLLLDNITFPKKERSEDKISYGKFQNLLLNKLLENNGNTKCEIELVDSDFEQFNDLENLDFPTTLYALLNIFNINKNNYLIRLRNFCGSSAAIPIARFSHLDHTIKSFIKEICNKEEKMTKNVIVAEICHIPQSRVGNVLFRCNSRNYEIPYLANSLLEEENIIDIKDIYIYHEYDTIKLYSKKHKKQVIPYLTCAHNYNNNSNIPLYQFLCDLQNQNKKNDFYFTWGSLEKNLKHIPRVRYKNIILSLAQWNIDIKSISHMCNITSDVALLSEIIEWRKTLNIPNIVLLSEFDNELYIDFSNIISIRSFLEIIKLKDEITLLEFVDQSDDLLVKDSKSNSYLNECLLFFYKI